LRIAFIYNPQADRGNALKTVQLLRQSVEIPQGEWISTQEPRHAGKLAVELAQSGVDRLVSVGGDGTLHEITNGLMSLAPHERPLLGVIPVGSGNDFCFGAGIPRNLVEATRIVARSNQTKQMDVGWLKINGRVEHFTNTMGFGFDAAVTYFTRSSPLRGKLMYTSAVLRTIATQFIAPQCAITLENGEETQTLNRRLLMITVGNGRREGGGFLTTPSAKVDDGRLDYLLFSEVSRPMMLRLIPEFMRGAQGKFAQAQMGQFTRMTLRFDQPLPIHTDGELMAAREDGVTEAEVGMSAGAVRLLVNE
jgi:YegS/Rv2252/BmrU family lipid kinase